MLALAKKYRLINIPSTFVYFKDDKGVVCKYFPVGAPRMCL